MSKHTPGPWVADIDNGDTPGHRMAALVRIGKDYWMKSGNIGGSTDDANARLMAAAPDLLAALKALLTAATYAAPPTTKFGEGAGLCYEARIPDQFVIDAQTVIAKAEGGQ